jgi:GntR family transcriptional regulator
LLQIEAGDPVHYFESVSLLGDGVPVEYSICKFRGDRNKFVVEITNNLYTAE